VLEFLKTLDRRWIFLAMLLAVAVPILAQKSFPEKPTKLVQDAFDAIEDLDEGSNVLLSFDYSPSSDGELAPMATAFVRHCCLKRHKMFFMTLWPDGLPLLNRTIEAVVETEESEEPRAEADEPEAPLPEPLVAELAWGFQDAVVDVLATKTIRAARSTGARSIVLGGGVAANTALRARLAGEADALGIPLIIPRPALCTDNGAMIGAAGVRRFAAGDRAGLDLDARPSLPLAAR
jgi:hypothetical protein